MGPRAVPIVLTSLRLRGAAGELATLLGRDHEAGG